MIRLLSLWISLSMANVTLSMPSLSNAEQADNNEPRAVTAVKSVALTPGSPLTMTVLTTSSDVPAYRAPTKGTAHPISRQQAALSRSAYDRIASALPPTPVGRPVSEDDVPQRVEVPKGVFGTDTRSVDRKTTHFPASAVVLITYVDGQTRQFKRCTGAVVSEDVVLTAAHCIYNSVLNTNFEVTPGFNGTRPYGVCSGVRYYVLEPWIRLNNPSERRLYDIGAIRVDCDVGLRTGTFGLAEVSDKTEGEGTRVRGYPCPGSQDGIEIVLGLQYRADDKIRLVRPKTLFYQNDTARCMSGSPLTMREEDTIIAVHGYDRFKSDFGPWAMNNAGIRLTRETIKAINQWIKG